MQILMYTYSSFTSLALLDHTPIIMWGLAGSRKEQSVKIISHNVNEFISRNNNPG